MGFHVWQTLKVDTAHTPARTNTNLQCILLNNVSISSAVVGVERANKRTNEQTKIFFYEVITICYSLLCFMNIASFPTHADYEKRQTSQLISVISILMTTERKFIILPFILFFSHLPLPCSHLLSSRQRCHIYSLRSNSRTCAHLIHFYREYI